MIDFTVLPGAYGLTGWIAIAARTARAGRANTTEMLVLLMVLTVVIGGVCAAVVAINRIVRRRRRYSHATLFSGLCKVHDLDGASRRLLTQAVRFHRLVQPARVFLEPKWLNPANLGPSFQCRSAELEELRGRLFSLRAETAGK